MTHSISHANPNAEAICLGLIADALFGDPLAGRPSLAEFLASPDMRASELSELGVDSLAWMGLLTRLETRLGIAFPEDLVDDGPISAVRIARAAAALMAVPEGYSGERFRVIDDFLPEPLFAAMSRHVAAIEFSPVDSVVDARIDRPALRANGVILPHDAPAGSGPVGETMTAVLETLRRAERLFGAAGADWSVLSAAFWKYPVGARLGWHNDAGKGRVGEFILYLHSEWKPSWGGEFLVLDAAPDDAFAGDPEPNVFKRVEARVARAGEPIQAIQPRPNRLILVEQGTPHAINRVDAAAGDRVRMSLTGFAALRERSQPPRSSRVAELTRLMGWDAPLQTA